ncbi:MAG TPA: RQC domain-containing protein, partial [Planctomycetota bacterium]|nr:RQC domain-containing protein [Planctomycetota bacterium]
MTPTPPSSEQPRSVLRRVPEVAFTALVCLRHLPFGVGRDLVAGILLGSAEKKIVSKRLDRNPAYGRVRERRGFVRGVLDDLVYEGYIDVKGSAERPTLTLSRRGEEVS